MHTLAILALDGVLAFDVSTPLEVFGRACLPDGAPAYQVLICAPSEEVDAGLLKLRGLQPLHVLADADTIIIPGRAEPLASIPDDVLVALHSAVARGARIASICVGAFTLAAAGLLDGLRATTHWAATSELAQRYPTVLVDANVLFVDNGQILTSAGAAAGLDLCLHMIRRDYGAAVAAAAARVAVMPLERAGGQAQFIVHEQPIPTGATLEPLVCWMQEHACQQLTLEDLAAQASVSMRTLSRRFREQMGNTPMQWLNCFRLRHAQTLLETTDLSIEQIVSQVGFGSSTTFRDRFKAFIGVSPQAYRRTFRGAH